MATGVAVSNERVKKMSTVNKKCFKEVGTNFKGEFNLFTATNDWSHIPMLQQAFHRTSFPH